MKFKITTFNLRLNVSSDKENAWPHRVNAIVRFINDANPLVIGTQEITDDMLGDLTKNLPNYDYISLTRRQHEEASTIFYNSDTLEFKEGGTFWLSKTPYVPNSRDFNSACVRVCTWGEFIFSQNRNLRFRVFNTHLDHISEEAKIEGIKIILDRMNRKNEEDRLPTLLMGDFNSTTQDPVIQFLKEEAKVNQQSLVDCMDVLEEGHYGLTFHNFLGGTEGDPIDHVFVTPDFNPIKTEIFKEKIDGRYPSDHYPVSVTFNLDEPLLTHSYHTHNERCKHAVGTIADFVKASRSYGIKTVGFTDHTPFKDNRLLGLRMPYDQLKGYIEEINEAKKNFNDITIYSGLECEYFRDIKDYYDELVQQVDYLILGQHFVVIDGQIIGNESFLKKEHLIAYVEHIEEALDSGNFKLLAHPDSFGLSYTNFDETAIEVTHRIGLAAKKNDVVLEINANGFRRLKPHGVPYPLRPFWEIIAKEYPEVKVIITPDAHHTECLNDWAVKKAFEFAMDLNIHLVDSIQIK